MNRRQFSLHLAKLAATSLPLTACVRALAKQHSITAVDTHAHVFLRSLIVDPHRRYTPVYDAMPDTYLALLDSHGVSHGVLVQPSFLGTDNSFLLQVLRQHPQRLRGVGVIEPTAHEAELADLQQAGVVAVRLNLIGLPIPDFHAGPWPALLRTIFKLGWHVEVHREAVDLPVIIDPLLGAGVNVVVDHFGRPDPRLGVDDPGFRYLLRKAASGRVWVKLSGAYRLGVNGDAEITARRAVPLLLQAFGPSRLVWGSDWPHTQYEKTASYDAARSALDEWVVSPGQRHAILTETPAKLYHF